MHILFLSIVGLIIFHFQQEYFVSDNVKENSTQLNCMSRHLQVDNLCFSLVSYSFIKYEYFLFINVNITLIFIVCMESKFWFKHDLF